MTTSHGMIEYHALVPDTKSFSPMYKNMTDGPVYYVCMYVRMYVYRAGGV